MKHLRQYIRKIIFESMIGLEELDGIIAPPPDKTQRVNELPKIQIQMENPYNPDQVQEALDTDFQGLFCDLLEMHGITENKEDLLLISSSALPTIKKLKNHYNVKRPQDLADQVDFPLESHQSKMDSAKSKSYPSGHACQAYLIAMILSEKYPHLTEPLLHLAECISQSRVDRGVHYPSDLVGGIELANHLFYNHSL
jgi:hypothetical protein